MRLTQTRSDSRTPWSSKIPVNKLKDSEYGRSFADVVRFRPNDVRKDNHIKESVIVQPMKGH